MKQLFFFLTLMNFTVGPVFGATSEAGSSSMEEKKAEIENPTKEPLTWGEFDPGKGVLLGKNEFGSISLSFYVLGRYINQLPATQSWTDHLGKTSAVDTRHDIELHRIIVWLKGWAYDPKLTYSINFWTVNSSKNIYTIGSLVYSFDPKAELTVGIEGLPGVRSLNGQHPYFLGTDRHLGDEFFKPGFTMGASLRGQLSPSFFYRAMIGNTSSEIAIPSSEFDRYFSYGASFWVLPTGEFGPRGGYGDYEMHSEWSSRYGLSFTSSHEDAYIKEFENDNPKNTQLKLSDGTNIFSPGALAIGTQVRTADYTILSPDVGFKYNGLFLDFNYYLRWLDNLTTIGGPIPQTKFFDHGLMVQIGKQVKPRKLELYTSYTNIWGEFNNPWEIAVGANYYPNSNTRNWRLNAMINHIEQSPVGSQFGFYSTGQTGETIVLASDVFF
jgi:hypothetical protein